MGSKQKICKCGHDKSFHKGESKLSFSNHCRECPCSSYLNRNRPDKTDYFTTFFLVGIAVGFMILMPMMLNESDPALKGVENELANLTNGELHEIMSVLLLAFGVLMLFWFVVDPLLTLIFQKKRQTFPIKDEDAKL